VQFTSWLSDRITPDIRPWRCRSSAVRNLAKVELLTIPRICRGFWGPFNLAQSINLQSENSSGATAHSNCRTEDWGAGPRYAADQTMQGLISTLIATNLHGSARCYTSIMVEGWQNGPGRPSLLMFKTPRSAR
jgi:hypothetical protein